MLTVYGVYNMTEETRAKKKDYGVKALPTAIIDGKSKLWIFLTFLGFVEVIRNKENIP